MNQGDYKEIKNKTKLERQLDDSIKSIHSIAGQDLFESSRKNFLLDECNALRSALQDLLKYYPENVISILVFIFRFTC